MAGDWIKFEISTPDKPEVFEIAGALDLDPDAVVGKLLRVWNWFDQHTENGNAPVTVVALLDRLTGTPGFCSAMEKAGWMILSSESAILPHFTRHNGKTAKNRALTARRVNEYRKCNADSNADSNAGRNDGVTKNSLPREEKRRVRTPYPPEGEKESPVASPESDSLTLSNGSSLPPDPDLHPLHCRLIRCVFPKSKCDRARDPAEMRAWKKARSVVREADVEKLEWFYGLAKSAECDPTWKRKSGVAQLLNQLTEQVELAERMREERRRRGAGGSTGKFESA